MNTATQREYWWTWTTDNLSGDIMVLPNFLDDDQFVRLISGGKPANLATIMRSTFLFACKIHSLNPFGEMFLLTIVEIV